MSDNRDIPYDQILSQYPYGFVRRAVFAAGPEGIGREQISRLNSAMTDSELDESLKLLKLFRLIREQKAVSGSGTVFVRDRRETFGD